MRIAISADDNNGLESVVSPHFGRCPHYVLVDVEGQEVKAIQSVDNPYYSQHAPGQVPGFINGQGVNVMLTGGMGRRAIGFFEQYGIEAVTGASGTVRYALERYLGGQLKGVQPCRESIEHAHGEPAPSPVEGYEQDDVGRLREEAEMLRRQLEEVTACLDKLGE
ncbi:MAG: NifB/NifX family molybdenum-iron cluster-binding protein [Anaerolineales bacterium]|nr:NifB/NifX family molybdenum-iron cluster-binding protein [Anaerolineales bacterium]